MKPSVVAQRKNSSASIIPAIKEFDIPRIFSIGFVLLTVQSFPPAFHKEKNIKKEFVNVYFLLYFDFMELVPHGFNGLSIRSLTKG